MSSSSSSSGGASSGYDPAAIAALVKFELSVVHTYIAVLVASGAIHGFFLSQVHTYFRTFRQDRRAFRALVFTLLALETGYMASLTAHVYQLVTSVIQQEPYSPIPTNAQLVAEWCLWTATAFAEGYFVYLCVKVSRSWVVRGVAVFFWLGEFSVWLTYNVMYTRVHITGVPMDDTTSFALVTAGIWSLFAIAGWTSGVLAWDLIIRREVKPDQDVLERFAMTFIGTSLILAILELIGAITSVFRDWTGAYLVSITNTALYVTLAGVSVLYNLNNRAALRRTPLPSTADGAYGESLLVPSTRKTSGAANKTFGSGGGAGSVLVSMEETREEESYRPGEFVELGALRSGKWKQAPPPLPRTASDHSGGSVVLEMEENGAR
ncbi:hypothetical protein JCM10207_007527 [Rhodosporidiobolus poonsookiae]